MSSPDCSCSMMGASMAEPTSRVWIVGDLCRAVADALDARFNPVTVRGELTGFARAASGHCYFALKDASGQIRAAMFKRAASLVDFSPRDGDLVEVRGRLGVYEPRGDLQLVVESMRQAGAGALFEEFVKLKARLQAQGLFDSARKRPLPLLPRTIGLVTSLGAAALHDVVSALQRRVPHIPVVLAPAPVQGVGAPARLVQALDGLYQLIADASTSDATQRRSVAPDVILLVRGGGSIEDLWAFNDETLARAIMRSPVPVVCGVGHETDFTIADFVADLRAPTPTAAAELVAPARDTWLGALELLHTRLQDAVSTRLDRAAQGLDRASARLGRPSALAAAQQMALLSSARRLRFGARALVQRDRLSLQQLQQNMQVGHLRLVHRVHERLERASVRLGLLDPTLVLQRGYAWVTDGDGRTITDPAQTHADQPLRATLAGGILELRVAAQE